ncbi:unnamed protein product [Rhizoctonia solani]|uniref:Uncharacterized protein n=1 Tax=Rhizoctonia solani TaxID=456999 RepID=A0A8H3CB10_9AGAM|nr:unnamed protein product [Rhizoctonia solani]
MGAPSRKYVDLIFKTSGKYGNWDPSQKVEVGDWGEIDKTTGAFIREGNIFKDPDYSAPLSDTQDTELVKMGGSEGMSSYQNLNANTKSIFASIFVPDMIRIASGVGTKFDKDLYSGVPTTGQLGVRVQSAWEFSPQNRSAVLTVLNAYSNYLEVGIVFPILRALRKLGGKAIVTEALHCPAYALFLSEKGKGGKASLALYASTSEAVMVANTSEASVGWKYASESGIWRAACALNETDVAYTPLYRVQKISRDSWFARSRGGPIPGPESTAEESGSEPYSPPWEELDEDGDEIPQRPISPAF